MKKVLRHAAAVLFTMLMIFLMTICSYAEEYYYVRDSNISIEMPDGWEVTEISADESKGKPYEHIMSAKEKKAENPLQLDIYFSWGEMKDDGYVYFHGDAEQAMEYYDTYGRDAVSQIYDTMLREADQNEGVTYGEPVFFDGEWDGFLKIPVSISADINGDGSNETQNHTVYITAQTTDNGQYVVNNILIFQNDSGEYQDPQISSMMDSVADGFFDMSYGEKITGGSTEESVYNDEDFKSYYSAEDIIAWISPFIVVAVIVVIIAAVIVRRRRSGVNIKTFANNKVKKKRNVSVGKSPKRSLKKDDRSTSVRYTSQEVSGIEKGYMESLKTLYKSGLLTKTEMNEMIEKHQHYNSRKGER